MFRRNLFLSFVFATSRDHDDGLKAHRARAVPIAPRRSGDICAMFVCRSSRIKTLTPRHAQQLSDGRVQMGKVA